MVKIDEKVEKFQMKTLDIIIKGGFLIIIDHIPSYFFILPLLFIYFSSYFLQFPPLFSQFPQISSNSPTPQSPILLHLPPSPPPSFSIFSLSIPPINFLVYIFFSSPSFSLYLFSIFFY